MKKGILSLLIFSLLITACSTTRKKDEKVVNVYSHRHYDSDKKVFALFTEKTGIRVNVVKANADELINKLELEGKNSPADVLITVDAGKLYRAKEKNLLQKIDLNISSAVPENLKDEDGYWQGITYRARVIAYQTDQVDPSELSTYEDLADDKWKNRILVRSSSSSYNQSLLASLINAGNADGAKSWAQGVVDNMARNPKGGDRDQIKAIASGVGELAIVNTYYIGLLLNSANPEDVKAGQSVKIFFPNQDGRGAHINVSGAGIAKHAPHLENAKKFIEFLLSPEAQSIYTNESYEYPANKDVPWSPTLQSWGKFEADDLSFSSVAANNDAAVRIFDEVGWE